MLILLYILIGFVAYVAMIGLGFFMGARWNRKVYYGKIVIEESIDGVIYRLELAGDPESLMFQKEVTFIVVPPDYEKLLSQ